MFVWWVRTGALQPGDYLVLDNATVHTALESGELVEAVAEMYDITLMFLPAYSPELNPCELVFAIVKDKVRRAGRADLARVILEAFRALTREQAVNLFRHCLLTPLQLTSAITN